MIVILTPQLESSVPQFEPGDAVVHPSQGAGIVIDTIKLNTFGEPNQYYRIEMVDERNTLMIPVTDAGEIGLRPATYGVKRLRITLEAEPEPLADHYRTRHSNLKNKVKSGDPTSVAEVLRDLLYREETQGLTKVDDDIKREAYDMLVDELAAKNGNKRSTARSKLNHIVNTVMAHHLAH